MTSDYCVHAANSRLPCGKLYPKLGLPSVFAGFPGRDFPRKWLQCAARPRRDAPKTSANHGNCTGSARWKVDWVWNRKYAFASKDGLKMHVVPRVCEVLSSTLGSQSNEPGTTKDQRIEVPPSSPATRPPFLHQWAGHTTTWHKWWSCWLPWRQQEPVSGEDCCTGDLPRPKDIPKLSATINLRGWWKRVKTPTFMPTYWGVPNSSRLKIVEPLK